MNVTTVLALCIGAAGPAAEPLPVEFVQRPDEVLVTIGGKPAATYVYADRNILRPYFAEVRTLDGVQVTRNHPPVKGKDPTDHATMHPGVWMAFGDISGFDFWRNKARVVHESFVERPRGGRGEGTFAVANRYVAPGDAPGESKRVVCREVCRYSFHVPVASGYLLIWDSTFSAVDGEFYFGDQEEMGLGVRVASPMAVKAGGTMLDGRGRRNERQIWGHASPWCDYNGTVDGRRVGVTIMCDARPFRPSWFHARDYGALVANPFGRRAFGKGPASRVVVEPGRPLRLRYGLYVHSGPTGDIEGKGLDAAFARFVEHASKPPN